MAGKEYPLDVNIVNMKENDQEDAVLSKNYHHGDLRRTLLEQARSLIDEHGAPALTMRRVAEASGVSAAASYRHFTDRDALLAGVLEGAFAQFRDALEHARQAESHPVSAYVAVGRAYLAYAREHQHVYRLMFGSECEKVMHPELWETAQGAFAVVQQAARDCASGGYLGSRDADEVAMAGWVNVHGLASLYADGMLPMVLPYSYEEATEALFSALLEGVVPSAKDFISNKIRQSVRRLIE